MRSPPDNPKRTASTLVELLVVLAIIGILVFMIAPHRPDRVPAYRMQCLSNQRQVVLGLLMFVSDHNDMFPAQVTMTKGGAAEPMLAGDVAPCYIALADYAPNPQVFRCPADKKRSVALSHQSVQRTNVSYFISLDASPTNSPAYFILAGDRHLEAAGKPVATGLFSLSASQAIGWTDELHKSKSSTGGIGFADGHAEWAVSKRLPEMVARQNLPTNRLAVP
jgi:hypothetical protein